MPNAKEPNGNESARQQELPIAAGPGGGDPSHGPNTQSEGEKRNTTEKLEAWLKLAKPWLRTGKGLLEVVAFGVLVYGILIARDQWIEMVAANQQATLAGVIATRQGKEAAIDAQVARDEARDANEKALRKADEARNQGKDDAAAMREQERRQFRLASRPWLTYEGTGKANIAPLTTTIPVKIHNGGDGPALTVQVYASAYLGENIVNPRLKKAKSVPVIGAGSDREIQVPLDKLDADGFKRFSAGERLTIMIAVTYRDQFFAPGDKEYHTTACLYLSWPPGAKTQRFFDCDRWNQAD